MKRSPLRPGTPLTRTPLTTRTRLAPVSARRRRENAQRATLLAELVAVRGPWCQARLDGCTRLADDGHETLTRARGGSITDPDNIALLCRNCHRYITDNPAWADLHGWTRHSWDRP